MENSKDVVFDGYGNAYQSIEEMCANYDVNVETFKERIIRGVSLQHALDPAMMTYDRRQVKNPEDWNKRIRAIKIVDNTNMEMDFSNAVIIYNTAEKGQEIGGTIFVETMSGNPLVNFQKHLMHEDEFALLTDNMQIVSTESIEFDNGTNITTKNAYIDYIYSLIVAGWEPVYNQTVPNVLEYAKRVFKPENLGARIARTTIMWDRIFSYPQSNKERKIIQIDCNWHDSLCECTASTNQD